MQLRLKHVGSLFKKEVRPDDYWQVATDEHSIWRNRVEGAIGKLASLDSLRDLDPVVSSLLDKEIEYRIAGLFRSLSRGSVTMSRVGHRNELRSPTTLEDILKGRGSSEFPPRDTILRTN